MVWKAATHGVKGGSAWPKQRCGSALGGEGGEKEEGSGGFLTVGLAGTGRCDGKRSWRGGRVNEEALDLARPTTATERRGGGINNS